MKQTLKNIFQPFEIAFKKAFGIRKERKGQIFDSNGFVYESKEKITRFILFLPLFQKIRILVNVSEFSNGAIATNTSVWCGMGGGNHKDFVSLNPHSTR